MKKNRQKLIGAELADTISTKLVSRVENNVAKKPIQYQELDSVTTHIKSKLQIYEELLDLFPETSIPMEVLITSIISPKDLLSVNIIINNETNPLPLDVAARMNTVLKLHLEKSYKFNSTIYDVLENALFKQGADIEMYIPESTLTDIINDNTPNIALEEYVEATKPITSNLHIEPEIQPDKTKYAGVLEEKVFEYVELVDNVELLQIADLEEERESALMRSNISNESYEGVTHELFANNIRSVRNMFKKLPTDNSQTVVSVQVNESDVKNSFGVPLVKKLPIEAVIPLALKSEPSKHLGYFIMLNEYGQPISKNDEKIKQDDELENRFIKNLVLNRATEKREKILDKAPTIDNIRDVLYDVINDRIKRSLVSNRVKQLSNFDGLQDIYDTMLSRVLSSKKTKLLYVPLELVSYISFDYFNNGVGRSLLDRISILASMRGALMMARMNASIKNSINLTKVTVKIDDDDPDPRKSMVRAISEVMKTNATMFSLGTLSINELVDWVHRAGYYFEFQHPLLPDMQINSEQTTSNYTEPDDMLEEELKKNMSLAFGVPPEIIDNVLSPNFASGILANHALFAKRVMRYRTKLSPQITDRVKKILFSDQAIRSELTYLLEENVSNIKRLLSDEVKERLKASKVTKRMFVTSMLEEYIDSIVTGLPDIDKGRDDGLAEAYDIYSRAIDTYIETYFSVDAMPDALVSKLGKHTDDLQFAVKHTLLRKWMRDNNYMTDLLDIFSTDSYGNKRFDIMGEYTDYLNGIHESIGEFLYSNNKTKKELDKVIEKYTEEEEEDEKQEGKFDGDSQLMSDETPAGDDADNKKDNNDTLTDTQGDVDEDENAGNQDEDQGDDETETE